MAYDVHLLSQFIRHFDARILSQFSEEFASSQPGHRKNLRSAIHDGLGVLSEPERGKLLNLDEVPDLEEWSISISHCEHMGGWVATPLPMQVGLDIEIKDRISDKLVKRIAMGDELKQIPNPAFLWCAKESYFKALAKDQPVAVTQIQVGGWERAADDFWTFSAPKMTGALTAHVDLLVSICKI